MGIEKDKLKITTVKILSHLYNDFKRENIENGFSLQKLVNRAMWLYVNDEDFQKKIEETDDLKISGSLSY